MRYDSHRKSDISPGKEQVNCGPHHSFRWVIVFGGWHSAVQLMTSGVQGPGTARVDPDQSPEPIVLREFRPIVLGCTRLGR
jgi:hypothetical protein